MKSDYNYELIRDYLDGLLDRSTSDRIGQLIADDEVARGIAKGIIMMRESFENDEQLDDYLNAKLLKGKSALNKVKTKPLIYKVAASIAILLAVGVSLFYSSNPSANEIVDGHLTQPYSTTAAVRAENESELNNAIAAYQNGDYLVCINLLKENDSAFGMFYKGLSALYLKEYQLAVQHLASKGIQQSRYSEVATWYLALGYYQSNQLKQAQELLNQIAENSDHFKSKEAKELLKAID